MGRIKTRLIKRLSRELLKKYPEQFQPSFEANKLAVQQSAALPSKKIRNIIAGYLARMVKKRSATA